MSTNFTVAGVVFDPIKRESFGATLRIQDGKIVKIEKDSRIKHPIILPGFIDSHVHIESSMLTPSNFAKAAVKHGTVAVVTDPHEIANVAGVNGVEFMINDAKGSDLKFYFGAPSCVPASPFDECFEPFTPEIIEGLMKRDDIHFLAEMMNFPGVIYKSESVMQIIGKAHSVNKPVDGHVPGLSGDALKSYVSAGITTDHECFTLEEALEKIKLGMKILIRDGSAAKNFGALHPLIKEYSKHLMFCTDDCHPDELLHGHINLKVKQSLALGYDIFDVLQVSSVNPVNHYKLNVGLLQEGDSADFLVVDNLQNLNIQSTFINGLDVLETEEKVHKSYSALNYVFPTSFNPSNLNLKVASSKVKAIEVINDELITNTVVINNEAETLSCNLKEDVLKIAVLSRYKENELSVGLIKGFGMKKGAIAASIAHDSHHIISVGCDNVSIEKCLDFIIKNRGGVCYFDGQQLHGLPLPVYGLMTDSTAEVAASAYEKINSKVISDGCKLKAPFMTMSFMSLSVIPHLKITPAGLFDVDKFNYTELFI
ncbi:MAG TPA: adenine deaminase [Tenuifilaceae bacterium]|nr:adenine deaminase [Tenuifilaceae bacterium]HPI43757.1 adenine deaminase [Tenuifilaceae bacterium]HPN20313.1 adenine deaminase [Tenuifilaceae bacterium]HPV55774.1 adenine deaminase [Tenuifilaceae bacterium]